jgi:hypothetical protein
MAGSSWSIHLPEGQHRIEVVCGYWFSKAIVRVDGRIPSTSRPILGMGIDRGMDLPD